MIRIGFDCETQLIVPGRLAPRLICLSLAGYGDRSALDGQDSSDGIFGTWTSDRSAGWSALLIGGRAIEAYRGLLDMAVEGRVELIAHNAPYDLAVTAEAAAVHPDSRGPLLDETFAALEVGAILDTKVREQLLNIAHSHVRRPPRGYFSLAGLVERYFDIDRSEEKGKSKTCETCKGSTWHRVEAHTELPCPVCEGFGSVGPWRLRYHQLDGVPLDEWPEEARTYAVQDAIDTLEIADAQDAQAGETEIGPVLVPALGRPDGAPMRIADELPQTRAAFAFHLMACHGVLIDPPVVGALKSHVEKFVAEGEAAGIRAGFIRGPDGAAVAHPDGENQKRSKPGTVATAALHALVDEAYGGQAPRTPPSASHPEGQVSADRQILMASGNQDLIAYAKVGAERTIYRTYLPILQTALAGMRPGAALAGPITSSPNVLVNTGRCSWRAPNWTNPPRKGGFRESVVPRPGWLLVSADYSGIQFWALGQICLWLDLGDDIAQAAWNGLDPHVDFAADMLGVPYTEALARYEADDPVVVERRQTAKGANYGFPGGMGPERFVSHAAKQDIILDPSEPNNLVAQIRASRRLKRQFLQKWPCIERWFEWVSARTGTMQDPRKFTFRQFVSGRLRGGVGYTDGCNGPFQGIEADGAKAATWRVVKACHASKGPLAGSRAVLFLHDEIIIEVPCGDDVMRPIDYGHLTAAGDALATEMIAGMKPFIPDIPVLAEPAATRRWWKGAKTLRDSQGQLMVWEPKAKKAAVETGRAA